MADKTVLWWGRFDPDYSRNRIVRALLADLGWEVTDFYPLFSAAGDIEAALRGMPAPTLVWVPCFRQRDAAAAARWARRRGVPMVFDPLISAWDKQVFERGKFTPGSARAARLREHERRLFAAADLVLADTGPHRDFFIEAFGLAPGRVAVVPVGAEESLFRPGPPRGRANGIVEILFYGSFIGLQGPQTIVQAARMYEGPPARWRLLGAGPLYDSCRRQAAGLGNADLEPWLPYRDLPARIARADILLGIFGDSDKAGRVIPNKVFQSLACGRPVITRASRAYPAALAECDGLAFVPPGQPQALAAAVADWAGAPERLPARGEAAAKAYREHFGRTAIREALLDALSRLPGADQAGTRTDRLAPRDHRGQSGAGNQAG